MNALPDAHYGSITVLAATYTVQRSVAGPDHFEVVEHIGEFDPSRQVVYGPVRGNQIGQLLDELVETAKKCASDAIRDLRSKRPSL